MPVFVSGPRLPFHGSYEETPRRIHPTTHRPPGCDGRDSPRGHKIIPSIERRDSPMSTGFPLHHKTSDPNILPNATRGALASQYRRPLDELSRRIDLIDLTDDTSEVHKRRRLEAVSMRLDTSIIEVLTERLDGRVRGQSLGVRLRLGLADGGRVLGPSRGREVVRVRVADTASAPTSTATIVAATSTAASNATIAPGSRGCLAWHSRGECAGYDRLAWMERLGRRVIHVPDRGDYRSGQAIDGKS